MRRKQRSELHLVPQKTHLNWCMNSTNSWILKKDFKLINPFQVKLPRMSAALQHSKAITHPSAWNHPVKLWNLDSRTPQNPPQSTSPFFFSHLRSFHFDASVWRRPSRTPLTFPIRLAQYGPALLIYWNAKATVAASVFSCLPASPHRPAHLPLPTPPALL